MTRHRSQADAPAWSVGWQLVWALLLFLCGIAIGIVGVVFVASAQTLKDCTGVYAVTWEQDAGDVVEWWQLVIGGTPQPIWPRAECTPVPSPTGGTGAPAYEHPVIPPLPSEPFWLLACNEDGCSDPSNVMLCVSPTPTATHTLTVTPTRTPTHTPSPIPTRTKKPKPHPPRWLEWLWRW